MAVGAEHHVARLHIASLRHQLMADAVGTVHILYAELRRKFIASAEVSGIVGLAGRHQVVIDEHHLVRVPDLLKSHLGELVRHEGDENVVHHHPVHIHGDDIPGLGRGVAHIAADDFLNQCRAHLTPPFRRPQARCHLTAAWL